MFLLLLSDLPLTQPALDLALCIMDSDPCFVSDYAMLSSWYQPWPAAYSCSLCMTLVWLLTMSLLPISADPGLPSDQVLDFKNYLFLPITERLHSLCTEFPRYSFQVPSGGLPSSIPFWCASVVADFSPETTATGYLIMAPVLLCALCT